MVGEVNAMKLLVTGFEPFGGETVNPAWEAVQRLPERIGAWELTKLQVPTVFGSAAECVLSRAQTLLPDAVVCVGQAGGRRAVTPELVAINLQYASIADNRGQQLQDVPCVLGAPNAYFSTLPVRRMAEAIRAAGLPGELSYSAGSFVCNDLLFRLLHRYDGTQTRVCFIHVPYLPEQAKNGVPSMQLDDIIRALEAAIAVIPAPSAPSCACGCGGTR